MFRSLRFRLPALFLLGVVVAGLVSAAIALRLFQHVRADQARTRPTTSSAARRTG